MFLTSRGGDRGEIVGLLLVADFHGRRTDFRSARRPAPFVTICDQGYGRRHGRRADFKMKKMLFKDTTMTVMICGKRISKNISRIFNIRFYTELFLMAND